LPGIDRPSLEQRETHSALLAREWYLGGDANLPPWKRRVLREVRATIRPIEPPVLDYLTSLEWRISGENFWFPRLLSSMFWVLGGFFLYRIATRLAIGGGPFITLAFYLVWPFSVWLSRHFMPDALMVACLLGAVLTVIRYRERPSRGAFWTAAATSALATLIKPGYAFCYLAAVFLTTQLSRRGLRNVLEGGRLPLFAAAAATPALLYYVIGSRVAHFIWTGAGVERLTPRRAATGEFWHDWWDAVSYLLRYPQPQARLALLPLAAGLIGLVLARPGLPRAVLSGLTLGYVAFAFLFATYVEHNPYYSLPLIPLLSLSIGTLGGVAGERLRRVHPVALLGLAATVAAVVAVAAYKSYSVMKLPISPTAIADYRRIGELTHHTTRAIVVANELREPAMYWGWISGETWDLAYSSPPANIHPERADYLVVVGADLLQTSSGLRRFANGLPMVAQTPRYAIFDVRRAHSRLDLRPSAGKGSG
jgi:4-amino-4-deoxy-L-arabinose transferase-like glycosyltransferase